MEEIDIRNLIPNAHVIFSALAVPELRDPLVKNLASLRLESGYLLDVEWRHDLGKYIVAVYDSEYVTRYALRQCDGLQDAISAMVQLSRYFADDFVSVSDAQEVIVDLDQTIGSGELTLYAPC